MSPAVLSISYSALTLAAGPVPFRPDAGEPGRGYVNLAMRFLGVANDGKRETAVLSAAQPLGCSRSVPGQRVTSTQRRRLVRALSAACWRKSGIGLGLLVAEWTYYVPDADDEIDRQHAIGKRVAERGS